MSPQITITELETMIRGGAVSEQGWTEDQLAEMERRWTVEPRVVYELHPRDDNMPPLTLLATLDRSAPQDVLSLIAEARRLQVENARLRAVAKAAQAWAFEYTSSDIGLYVAEERALVDAVEAYGVAHATAGGGQS